MAEHLLCKERVRSSSLLVSTTLAGDVAPETSIRDPLIRVLRPEATDQRTAGGHKPESRFERGAPLQLEE